MPIYSRAFGGPSLDDALDDLRKRVLFGALNVLAVAVPAVAVLMLVQAWRLGELGFSTVCLSAYTLVFPLLRILAGRIPFRVVALLNLIFLLLTALIITVNGGVAAGNVALCIMVLILATLFFGRLGAIVALLAIICMFTLCGVLIVAGLGPSINLNMWDPTGARFWLRQTVTMALMSSAVALTVVYIVERLVNEASRARRFTVREHQQLTSLERVEQEREHEREQRLLAQKALDDSRRIEAIARLSGGIAHDFNNALTVIIGAADMARHKRNSPDEVEKCTHDILHAANGAAELTRQLLTLGRRQISKPEPVPMAETLAHLQEAFRRVLPSDINLVNDSTAGSVKAYIDPIEFERALLNLVLNARDAMPDGGRLCIGCHERELVAGENDLPPGRYVALSVADSGHGMDAATRSHIFEPFFTTKDVGSGTGLGLATVQAFAKHAGGDVTVVSAPGSGTTFTLLLPAYVASTVADIHAVQHTGHPHMPAAGARILLVEDRDDVRAGMMRILRSDGFDVTDAADGDRALQLLEQGTQYALMCIDGVMPGVASADVIAKVEARFPQTRILLCSGYVKGELLRRGIQTGRYAFLAKPFSAQQLLDSVYQLLSSTDRAVGAVDS